jgi:hypothetical protein
MSSFLWDGSYLGILNEKDISFSTISRGNRYIVFSLNGISDIAILKSSTTVLPCILDEMKPFFSLKKIGTHWVKYCSKIFILYHANFSFQENSTILFF